MKGEKKMTNRHPTDHRVRGSGLVKSTEKIVAS